MGEGDRAGHERDGGNAIAKTGFDSGRDAPFRVSDHHRRASAAILIGAPRRHDRRNAHEIAVHVFDGLLGPFSEAVGQKLRLRMALDYGLALRPRIG
jgi:hypothetical protein